MRKEEYLVELRQELNGYEKEMVQEILQTFEEHFTEGLSRGMSEEEIIQELGDVREVASELRGMEPDAAESRRPADSGVDIPQSIPEAVSSLKYELEPQVSCLIIETLHTCTDVFLSPGDTFLYQIEPVKGITLGSGLFLPSRIFGSVQEPEILCEVFGRECRVSVRKGGGKLQVTVPASIQEIQLHQSSGDAEAADLSLEQLSGRSSSGDLVLKNCTASAAEFKGISGDIRTSDCRFGKAAFHCVSGDIKTVSCTGELMLQTNSGDVVVKEHTGGVVDGKSKSGDVCVATDGEVTASVTSGNVDLTLTQPGIRAEAFSTSGHVKCHVTGTDFTATLSTKSGSLKNKTHVLGKGDGKEMRIGRGTAQIRLKSTSGDVILLEDTTREL